MAMVPMVDEDGAKMREAGQRSPLPMYMLLPSVRIVACYVLLKNVTMMMA